MTQLLAYEKLVRKIASPEEPGGEEGEAGAGAAAKADAEKGGASVRVCHPGEGQRVQPAEGVGGDGGGGE